MSNFYTLLTDVGASAMAIAAANNTPLNLSEVVLGDGNGVLPTPTVSTHEVVNEVYRAGINSITQDPVNSAWYIIELVVPPNIGGFHVREFAIKDSGGTTIFIGNHPPEYKPSLAEGSTRDTIYRLIVETSNAATINLIVDPNIVMATHDYVLVQFASHVAEADPHPQYALKTGVQAQQYSSFTTTGASPAFIGSVTPNLTAYATGHRFRAKFHENVNDASTININGLGVKSLKQYDADGSKINPVIAANQSVDIEYDGVDFVLLNPTSSDRGVLTKSVAGGSDVTLTRLESANEIIVLTGALTGNINLILPSTPIRSWIIRNTTTGAYRVTAKTAAGTGFVCLQNNNSHIFTDGVNVYGSIMQGSEAIKYPARIATTANIANLASGAPSTLDGVAVALNNRILVKDQTTKSQNGIYVVNSVGSGADGVWVRAGDADDNHEVIPGMLIVVQEGEINQDTIWELATNAPITLGSSNIDFIIKDGNRVATISGISKNLVIGMNSGPPVTFSISADEIVLKNPVGSAFLATSLSKTLNPANSGVNGLDTGALAATNWYYIWAISDGSLNTDVMLSLSNSAPTMPVGYTYKALIGCVNRASSLFLNFAQRGNFVKCIGDQWNLFSAINAGTAPVILPLPATIAKEAFITIGFDGAVGESRLNITADGSATPIASITSINGDNQSISRRETLDFVFSQAALPYTLTYVLSHNVAGTTFFGKLQGFRI